MCLSCGSSEPVGNCGKKCCIMQSLLFTGSIQLGNKTSLIFSSASKNRLVVFLVKISTVGYITAYNFFFKIPMSA